MHTEIGVPLLARLGFHETGIDESETPWITQELRFLGLEQIRRTAIILANCEEHKKTARQIPSFGFQKEIIFESNGKLLEFSMAIVVPKKKTDSKFYGFPVLKGVFPEKFTHANSVREIFSKIFWMHIYIIDTNVYAKCICE